RIDAYQKRKHREGKRVHPTTLHYVWAREFGECKGKKHYHLMLPVHPGNAGQPAMPSGGDEHSVRAALSHEYVAARRGCICRS
ncbi:YagK/YfjJ domain-containing protein, partial [Escherichia coli]|uniref:YagK/YfjJ domain-containing protein n=1 Tax=Escherichia coli TaxID=562 RepID=UPI0027DE5FDF